MKTTEMLKRIQTLLNARVELEDRKLDNGTVISADEFAEGQPVFIVTEDERIPMPIGEYQMEDGSILVVEEEGMIAAIKPGEEAPKEVVEEVVEEMSEATAPKKVVDSTVVETPFSNEQKSEVVETILSIVNPLIEELQNKVSELEAKLSQEEVKEEVVKEQLSKAFKHTPEVKSKKKQIKFSENRTITTFDRVLAKISNK